MDIDAYLRRIRYAGARSPTLEVLRALAKHHALAIPFENLSVLLAGAPDLELAGLESKLVRNRRGGYCYEQNSLLLAVLTELGFKATGHSARVRYGVPAAVPTPRSHMVLRVEMQEGRMLVDAGFGGLTLTAPVMMDSSEPQQTPLERVRMVPIDDGFLLQAEVRGDWTDVYSFDFSRQYPVDYVQQNWHTATRPGALFANNVAVALPTPQGRHALFNRTLTWRPQDGEKVQQTLDSPASLRSALIERFNLEPPAAELAKAWEVSGRGLAPSAVFS